MYRLGGAPATWHQAVLAACLGAGPTALASHGTAARLWRLEPAVPTGAIHVVTSPSRRVRLEGVVAHRTTVPAERRLVDRVPVTSPTRTLVDLAACVPPEVLDALTSDAIRRRLTDVGRLQAALDQLGSGGGRRPSALHEVVRRRSPAEDDTDSDLERRALRALARAGLPAPVVQHVVRLGRRILHLDLAYPEQRIAIELDGWDRHGTRTAFDRDRERANLLVVAGWRVVRFTSRGTDEQLVAVASGLLVASGERQ